VSDNGDGNPESVGTKSDPGDRLGTGLSGQGQWSLQVTPPAGAGGGPGISGHPGGSPPSGHPGYDGPGYDLRMVAGSMGGPQAMGSGPEYSPGSYGHH